MEESIKVFINKHSCIHKKEINNIKNIKYLEYKQILDLINELPFEKQIIYYNKINNLQCSLCKSAITFLNNIELKKQ